MTRRFNLRNFNSCLSQTVRFKLALFGVKWWIVVVSLSNKGEWFVRFQMSHLILRVVQHIYIDWICNLYIYTCVFIALVCIDDVVSAIFLFTIKGFLSDSVWGAPRKIEVKVLHLCNPCRHTNYHLKPFGLIQRPFRDSVWNVWFHELICEFSHFHFLIFLKGLIFSVLLNFSQKYLHHNVPWKSCIPNQSY